MKKDELTVISPEDHREIVDRIQSGAHFIYPTDTAYGLGASIRNEDAVRQIFKLKERSPKKTVPVLTTSIKARKMVRTTEPEEQAIEVFWPGGLTLVLDVTVPEEYPPGLVRSGTIALRAPGMDYLREVLAASPPIVGTSANPAGARTPYERSDLDEELLSEVDFLVEGDAGGRESSTVAEWDSAKERWRIHRTGPVSSDELEEQTKPE